MRKALPHLFVLVDKRGVVLEQERLRRTTAKRAGVPLQTTWSSREGAKIALDAIKEEMTREVWETWQFRIVQYIQKGESEKPMCESCGNVQLRGHDAMRTRRCARCRRG